MNTEQMTSSIVAVVAITIIIIYSISASKEISMADKGFVWECYTGNASQGHYVKYSCEKCGGKMIQEAKK